MKISTLYLPKTLFLLLFCCSFVSAESETLNSKEYQEYLAHVYDNRMVETEKAVATCHNLNESLSQKSDLEKISENFSQLVTDWKHVESLYLLGDYDETAIDIPQYIDAYRRGNEKLSEQLARILKSSEKPSVALFKHSFKTITALEIFLHSKENSLSDRQIELSIFATENICKRMENINQLYGKHKKDFVQDPPKAIAVILNRLIDNSFKLKEWRLGEPAGISRKTRGKPSAQHAEFYLSKNSVESALAIMKSHQELTHADGDFAKVIALLAISEKTEQPVKALSEANEFANLAVEGLKQLQESDLTNTATMKPIYQNISDLNDAYLVDLVGSLHGIVAKILDSDGD